jgi:hypothetical protein
VKSLTEKAVKNKEIEIAKDIKNNPKKFWQYTKSKTKTRTGISDLIINNENGVETLINSDKDKANTLSDLFSSVFTTETTDNYPSLEGINISYNMDTLVIEEEKVKNRLHELNISKSPDPAFLYGVYISQLIRYARTSSNYSDFLKRHLHLRNRLLDQGY